MRADIIPSVSHVRRAAGKDRKIVVRCRQGKFDIYPKPPLKNPNTSEQQQTRTGFQANASRWIDLPAEVKGEWNAFAATRGRAFGRLTAEPLSGYQLYKSAAFFRNLLGLGDPPSAPVGMPPPPPTHVELLPSAEPDTLRLRLNHQLTPGAFSVVVSMTPPTLRPSRKPDERNKRYVKGLNASSTASLPAGGDTVTFTNCRYTVAPGQRFGVWIRIIRQADGLASQELMMDFIRPEAEEEPVSPSAPVPVTQPTPALSVSSAEAEASLHPKSSFQTQGCGETPGRRENQEQKRGSGFPLRPPRSPASLRSRINASDPPALPCPPLTRRRPVTVQTASQSALGQNPCRDLPDGLPACRRPDAKKDVRGAWEAR